MTKRERMLSGIITILVIIIVIGMAFVASELKNCNVTNNSTSNAEDYEYKNINMSEYKNLIKDKEKHIIYIARPTCGYCQKEDPVLKVVASEHNLEINYLNIDELTSSEMSDLRKTSDALEKLSTPTFLIVNDGSIAGYSIGYLEQLELETLFKKYEMID